MRVFALAIVCVLVLLSDASAGGRCRGSGRRHRGCAPAAAAHPACCSTSIGLPATAEAIVLSAEPVTETAAELSPPRASYAPATNGCTSCETNHPLRVGRGRRR
jgi:hypothetical protein